MQHIEFVNGFCPHVVPDCARVNEQQLCGVCLLALEVRQVYCLLKGIRADSQKQLLITN
jgi:hypothetical protein